MKQYIILNAYNNNLFNKSAHTIEMKLRITISYNGTFKITKINKNQILSNKYKINLN